MKDEAKNIPTDILRAASEDAYFGRMNDPSASAFIRGLCGDEMEFYLIIRDGVLTEIKYYTDGCVFTKACAGTVCRFAVSKTVAEALRISPQQVVEGLKNLPEEYIHCSILAVSTFYKALADYLLQP